MDSSIKVLTGNANSALAAEVAEYLNVPLADCGVGRFADGEVHVRINESVRGKDVFVVQSLCKPVNDHVMELLIMVDALKRSSAGMITAVIPYYGYARQDRQDRPRTPITAKLLADLLTSAGVQRVMAMDLHAGQIQGFFSVPFEHLYATPALLAPLKKIAADADGECVVVSPDAGGVERARHYSKKLRTGLAIIDKRRPKPNVAEIMNIIGDVEGRTAIIVDDMIDTAGTLCNAAAALKKNGAREVFAVATHGLFNEPAASRIAESELSAIYVTNTIPVDLGGRDGGRVKVVSVGSTIGEAIKRVHAEASVSSLWI